MKASFHIIIIPFTLTGMLMAGVAFGNPVMLPQHPGYPMGKATDPVNGQSLANDPGRANAVGEKALNGAAAFDDRHVSQQLPKDEQNQRLLEKPGAGILPKVQGPQIMIDPPVKEGTKVQASPQERTVSQALRGTAGREARIRPGGSRSAAPLVEAS